MRPFLRLAAPITVMACLLQTCFAQRSWTLLDSFGIKQTDGTWMAGRIWDALDAGNGQALVAGESSGVWWLRPNLPAIPLSRDWDSTMMLTLAIDPSHPAHYFAGGVNRIFEPAGALYETRIGEAIPLFAPWNRIPLPPSIGVIHRILVLGGPPRIVLATETGIFWSPIPATGAAYSWSQSDGVNSVSYWDIAQGPLDTLVVGTMRYSRGTTHFSPIQHGVWLRQNGRLILTLRNVAIHRSSADPCDAATFGTTSVASFWGNPAIMYAAASGIDGGRNADGPLSHFLVSTDGGVNWSPKPNVPSEGRQGIAFTNCVSVDPNDSRRVAIGWGHLWLSTNGGDNFSDIGSPHDDHHTARWFGTKFYDCNDGGLAISTDGLRTFSWDLNRTLPNLLFYPFAFDAFGGSSIFVGGGLQDHNAVYTSYAGQAAPPPWQYLDTLSRGDGGPVGFVPGGAVWSAAPSGVYHYGDVIAGVFNDRGAAQVVGTSPDEFVGGAFLHTFRQYRVVSPIFTDWQGRKLRHLMCSEPLVDDPNATNNTEHYAYIYGWYSGDSASGGQWTLVASVKIQAGGMASALGSYDGTKIYVGSGPITTIDCVDSVTRAVTHETGFPPGATGFIDNMAIGSNRDMVAISNNSSGNSTIYQLARGHEWAALTGMPDDVYTSAAMFGPTRIFLSTRYKVYQSDNDRGRWTDMSAGLPHSPFIQRITVAADPVGTQWLYAATFGWSVWKYQIR